MTNRIMCYEHETLLKLIFLQLMERHHFWSCVLILIYQLDAHDMKQKCTCDKVMKNALLSSMNSAFCTRNKPHGNFQACESCCGWGRNWWCHLSKNNQAITENFFFSLCLGDFLRDFIKFTRDWVKSGSPLKTLGGLAALYLHAYCAIHNPAQEMWRSSSLSMKGGPPLYQMPFAFWH